MLASPAEAPFSSKDWIFEIKWDGIRAISYINEELRIKSRNDIELEYNFPELQELKTLIDNAVLDGEIVVMREGKPDFQTLIERSNATDTRDIEYMAQKYPATYVVFDILEKDGKPLVDLPLMERKNLLKGFLKEGKHVILSLFVEEEGEAYFELAVRKGIEGIMAKRKNSLYEPGVRSHDWLKIKKLQSCDCVIFGYTRGTGIREETFGALILGLYDEAKPIFVGKVGTGFTDRDQELLLEAFKLLVVEEKTLEGLDVPEEVTWLKPQLVCQVVYQSATKDGKLRMARYSGLRLDKTPTECKIDQLKQGGLQEYALKRDFTVTPEPQGVELKGEGKTFVVQEHHARRLHYDLRLERQGVLKSWAVPRGIPDQPGQKRLAVATEDHPIDYASFEGTIPQGEYGAGTVKIWDKGEFELKVWTEDKIEFTLKGQRLKGRYVLARFKKANGKNWLLIKARD
jgi:DNA ligase D-like protein (predicted ligase)/DNA ligase D-like protein (predicted 3'-phosphoesterase)